MGWSNCPPPRLPASRQPTLPWRYPRMLSHPRLLNRRQVLEVGGVSVLGLGLPELLQAGRSSPRRSEKSCIFIFQYGGPPQLDTFDPKPDAPDGIRSPF